MVFVVDIGNSSITVGLFDVDTGLVCKSKYSTDTRKSADEYASLIYNTFALNSIDPVKVNTAVISSVVPTLTEVIRSAVMKVCKTRIYVLGPGLKTKVNISTDDPAELGADIVANAVGALGISEPPLVVTDVGTATSIFAINRNRSIIGCSIAPGIRISLDALKNSTSQLPSVSLSAPDGVVGKNTEDSMRSGLIFGHAMMIDGMIDAFAESMGERSVTAVITGGLAHTVLPLLKHKVIYSEDLTLDGLFGVYKINKK